MKRSVKKYYKGMLILAVLVCLLPSGLPAHEEETNEKEIHEEETHSEGEERSGSSGENHLLGEGDRAPDFILTDQNHNQVSLGDFKGRPRFVVFIYTHCEDVCPVVIENRKRLERDLAPSIGEGIIFLAVTIDPERDTPEVLKRFVKKIGVETKDLYLLGGNPQDVEKVLRDYNISVFRDRRNGHVVGHSSVGFAIDGEGIIRETLQFSI